MLQTTEGQVKIKHSINSQNAFQSISFNAEAIGMIVKSAKTNVLFVSDALSYSLMTFFHDAAGEKIESSDSLKGLGFQFSDRPLSKYMSTSLSGR